MRSPLRSFVLWLGLAALASVRLVGAGTAAGDAAAVRATLVRALGAEGAEQQRLLGDLGNSGSRLARDVLTAWSREEIYQCPLPDGSKAPALLEDQQDAQGRSRAIRIDNGDFVRDAQGKEAFFDPNNLDSVDTSLRLRSAIQQTIDQLALADPDPEARRAAALKLGNSQKLRYIPLLQARLALEPSPEVRKTIAESVALLQLGLSDPAAQAAAAEQLARLKSIGSLDRLRSFAASPATSHGAAVAARRAVDSIEGHLSRVNAFGTAFHGISLGSILLVVALGLAITFGLMGVINMAHGEMIAVGAYTCYVIQNLFGSGFSFSILLPFTFAGKPIGFGLSLPGLNAAGWLYESYFIVALPLSFLAAALAGLALERTVIRFLYRRPLESLLATWGVSLVLQQVFRMVFGANNVQVNSPSWLLGHFSVDDVVFDYNRVFVVGFAVAIVGGTALLLSRTPLGLLIRAVMQNRDMAACMGVRTQRVNMLTFAFGSGLAGLAGAFLSQIGNVGPSLGQSYIVDSFMTVVVGGVGSIGGTVCSAFGIGTADETLQQVLGSPVMGKIIVLIAIIIFLQWKPSGLFSARSRNLD